MKNTKQLAALTTVLIKVESIQDGLDKLIEENQNHIKELLNLIK